jgi:hypothetical protein
MSFVARKLPLAEQDALDAAIWYEQRQPGLGEEFLGEVDRAVRTLSESALHYRIRFADCVARQYIASSSTGFTISFETKRFGYWRSFTVAATRER